MSVCTNCGLTKTKVVETRTLTNGWTRRRRRCVYGCAARWTTYEVPADQLTFTPAAAEDADADDPSGTDTTAPVATD